MERRLFLILLALSALMMVGCYQVKAYHNKQIDLVGDYKIKTIVYQGCEYIVMDSHYQMRSVITHKGNCRFCKEHRQKELKELIIKLKENKL
jgi:hypothetical protein